MNGIQEVEGSIPFVSTRKKARTVERLYEPSAYQKTKGKQRTDIPKTAEKRKKSTDRRTVSNRGSGKELSFFVIREKGQTGYKTIQ